MISDCSPPPLQRGMQRKESKNTITKTSFDESYWRSCIDDIPLVGISIAAMQKFADDNRERIFQPAPEEDGDAQPLPFEQLTTCQVCLRVIKPQTLSKLCAYSDLIRTQPVGEAPSISNPNVFVSHSWKFLFVKLLEVLQSHFRDHLNIARIYVWVDIFVIVQHEVAGSSRDSRWFADTFKETIKSIGSTLLVLHPWHAPMPLSSSWCLWEIYSSLSSKVPLAIALPASDEGEFIERLTTNVDDVVMAMSKIDVRKASSYKPADKQMIDQAVEESPGGFSEVNKCIHDRLRQWLVDSGRKELEARRAQHGTASPATLLLMSSIARMLFNQSQLEQAEALYEEALRGRRETLGAHHPDTLKTMDSFAGVLRALNKLPEAQHYYEEAMTLQCEVLGPSHKDTLETKNNLAHLLRAQGLLEQAERLYSDVLNERRKQLGSDAPDTLISMNGLGILYGLKGMLVEATALLHEALKTQRRTRGDTHPDTLFTMINVGNVLKKQGRFDEAELLYEQAFRGRRETLGESHKLTQIAQNLLDSLQAEREEPANKKHKTDY